MADLAITARGPREFDVRVSHADAETSHRVAVPDEFVEQLELPEEDLERVVRESFEFLLEREPPSSLMSEFSLDVIARYFPEYERELQ